MSTVTSFLTNISIQGQKLAYVDTAPFSINGITYRGLINTSQSGSDFIITQRFTSTLFHNIQVNETQFMVQVSTGDFLPAEIRNVIGKGQFFLTTTNNQTVWYFKTSATTGSQSNVDLTTLQSGFITNSSNLFLSIVNGRLTMSSNAGQFNTVKPSNSNLIIGATSLSGNSGGGSGGITLTPSGALSSSYYIPFSSTISGVVTTMGTDVSGLLYDNSGHSLTVKSVVTNKIGTGTAPESTSLSIGNNALLNNNGINSNTAIGHESLFNNIIGYSNIAIGGRALYENIEGANNIAIGDGCLSSNISGNNNIGMGSETLGNNINGGNNIGLGIECLHENTEGSNNISLGYQSLYNNISGNSNISIGTQSLLNNTIGNQNIAIGVESLKFNISGDYNVAIGSESMYTNTDGGYNVAFGSQSLYNNTNGFNNTAIGIESMYSNTIGEFNVSMGRNALYGNIDGNQNTAVGYSSLYSNTNSSSNVSIGNESMYNNTIGGQNTVVGRTALYQNLEGNNNVAVGFSALYSGNGNNNIGIGNNAGGDFVSNESNNIVIGNTGVAGDNNIIRIGNSISVAAYIEPVLLRRLTVVPYTSSTTIDASDLINSLISTTNDIDLTLPLNTSLLNALGTTVFDNASFNFTVYSTNTTQLLSGVGRINIIGNPVITPGTTRIFVMQYIDATTTWNLY